MVEPVGRPCIHRRVLLGVYVCNTVASIGVNELYPLLLLEWKRRRLLAALRFSFALVCHVYPLTELS